MPLDVRIYTWRVLPLIGLGLRALLEGHTQLRLAGAYEDASKLLKELTDAPDDVRQVVLVDFADGFAGTLNQIEGWRSRLPSLSVIFLLPAYADEPALVQALRAGASGYLLQSASPEMLLKAMETVAAGQSYLGPEVTPVALAELRRNTFIPDSSTDHLILSEREQKLVQLSADGLSPGDIAAVVGLAEKTVRNLWSGLFDKLGMEDRTQVILWAIRTGQVVIH